MIQSSPSSNYWRYATVSPRNGSNAYNVRPSEVKAKERMMLAKGFDTIGQSARNGFEAIVRRVEHHHQPLSTMSMSNLSNNQNGLNKVLTLAKTYEPNASSNKPITQSQPQAHTHSQQSPLSSSNITTPNKESKGSIIKIIDNKITDFAPRLLSSSTSSPAVSSSSSSASTSPSAYTNKSFKNEAQIQLHSTSTTIPNASNHSISSPVAKPLVTVSASSSDLQARDSNTAPSHIEINVNVS